MNKRLILILNSIAKAQAGEQMGACCCKDKNGNIKDCRASYGEQCGQSYEAWVGGWICTFYENYPCSEVCFDAAGTNDGQDGTGEPTPSAPSTTPPSAPPPAPPTSPSAPPAPLGTDNNEKCDALVRPLIECLSIMNVGTSNQLRKDRTRLLKLVKDWRNNRCIQVEQLCFDASGGGGQSGPIDLQDWQCYCNAHREYFAGLKNIVEQFCSQSPPLFGKELNARLVELCRQFRLARAACKNAFGIKDPIDDIGNRECGFSI
jgi:hypothetical protein